ncbi:MAG: aminotransferase class V-fold PLP-dependent enzyme [Ruminococcaceae bacterium]|nr:aminotransferase class V-fold PLP-dependent enzyme [Oscillospiraceae bacterium]
MSKTPIYDFVKKYADENNVRLHMPGHKGKEVLGCERYDITEINGADSLFECDGVIAESEKNLSHIYNTRASFYSTEGSSLCIRAMVFLAMQYADGKKKILAGRNAHKSFLSALALCDVEADWLYGDNLYSCNITAEALDKALAGDEYFAVYVTNPDYLGNMVHIKSLSDICHKHGIPLLVDNAHGAYLKFTGHHPMDNGADMCCDSAHKTLSCLTGAAYLHVSKDALYPYEADAKRALSLFASTSPSYLIMASMDLMNEKLSDGYEAELHNAGRMVDELKTDLSHLGFEFTGREKLKINIKTKSAGYLGTQLCKMMEEKGIYPEFCDDDNLVMMFTPQSTKEDFEQIIRFFSEIEKKTPITSDMPVIPHLQRAMSVRQAMFSSCEKVNVEDAVGRILAHPCVSCPPAIPIAVCGEVIDDTVVNCFKYFKIEQISVVK